MSEFEKHHKNLLRARKVLAELPTWTKDNCRDWCTAHESARSTEADAIFGMQCLTLERATLAELEHALILVDGCLDSDLGYRVRGGRAMAKTAWETGDRVVIDPPLRMGERDGDPMVPYHDYLTGKHGRIMGMSPDGMELEIRLSSEFVEWVYHERVSRETKS